MDLLEVEIAPIDRIAVLECYLILLKHKLSEFFTSTEVN